MNEHKGQANGPLTARNLLPVVLALLLGASLTTNLFQYLQAKPIEETAADDAACDGFWCSWTTWE